MTFLSQSALDTSSSEVRPAQTLAEAIQEVVNEVARELNERQQQAMVRQNSSAEVPQSTDEGEAVRIVLVLCLSWSGYMRRKWVDIVFSKHNVIPNFILFFNRVNLIRMQKVPHLKNRKIQNQQKIFENSVLCCQSQRSCVFCQRSLSLMATVHSWSPSIHIIQDRQKWCQR